MKEELEFGLDNSIKDLYFKGGKMRETLIQKLICPTEVIKYYKGSMIAECMEKYDLNLFQVSFVVEELPEFELLKMVAFHTSDDGTYYYNGIQHEYDELETALLRDNKLLIMNVIPFEKVEK